MMSFKELRHLFGNRLKTDYTSRYSYARDASLYRLIPKALIQPRDESEIKALFDYCRQTQTPLTFRAGGTSLSGQAITDSLLVEINEFWRGYSIAGDAKSITLQPGVVGGHANMYLAPYNRIIGPDPASLASCFIGGIVANNASGMSCGVKGNSAHTLKSMRIVLTNGTVVDSNDPNSDQRLKKEAPHIYQGLLDIKKEIESKPELKHRISDKFSRKNTTGYSLNAFVDFDSPTDILIQLMVGSEGTLGFISEVTLHTFKDQPWKATSLLLFESIEDAANAVFLLKETGASALEIMDRAALRSVENEKGMPGELKKCPPEAAALLCEYQSDSQQQLQEKVKAGRRTLDKLKLLYSADFTFDEAQRTQYWQVRKGLFPSVGAMRPKGTTVIIEDIGFRLKDLAPAILDLQTLFKKHGYEDTIIFGHTEAGNIHFVLSAEFSTEKSIRQYNNFMQDVIDLTVSKYDGALKTEHGTGRNMAPFVETEWGKEATALKRKIKDLLDPDHILNPDVIITDDKTLHLKHLKPIPVVHDLVDKCIECGFCEVWCPSKDLTMTPRRRIATLREIQSLQQGSAADKKIAKALQKGYRFDGIESCAVDGLCAMGCPVEIDTGDLIRYFRRQAHSMPGNKIAAWTVTHFAAVVKGLRIGLNLAALVSRLVGRRTFTALYGLARKLTFNKMAAWNIYMPSGAKKLPEPARIDHPRQKVVYFPSCLSRSMGTIKNESYKESLPQALLRVSSKAGIALVYPDNIDDLCCGTPYTSKGFQPAFYAMAKRVINSLYEISESGTLPIVIDTSPCTYKVKMYGKLLNDRTLIEKWQVLNILDIVEFMHDYILPNVDIKPVAGTAVLHPTCSNVKMELDQKMLNIAKACAEEAVIPNHYGCCGFAGDRGMLVPQLTASATRREASDVHEIKADAGHYSTSRTCEVGMSSATGKPYSSIIHLLNRAARRKSR